jgi:hypothetical protein
MNAIFQGGGEKIYLDADMSAAVGLRDPLQAQPVAQAMQAEGLRGVDAVYYKTQTGQTWSYEAQYLNPQLPSGIQDAFGYLVWTMATDTSPDVVVVYAPGTSANGSAVAGFDWSGGRLGLQWDDQHTVLVLSGHGIMPGTASSYPARLVDVAPTLAAVMGLHIQGADGIVLADALEEPPPSSEHRQAVTGQWLSPLVDILVRRAGQRSS